MQSGPRRNARCARIAAREFTRSDPRREAFLRVTSAPPLQTMGRNGGRAAGVMRPEMAYLFIGRQSIGKPTSPPKEGTGDR